MGGTYIPRCLCPRYLRGGRCRPGSSMRDGRRRSGDLHRSMASAKGIERDIALAGRIHLARIPCLQRVSHLDRSRSAFRRPRVIHTPNGNVSALVGRARPAAPRLRGSAPPAGRHAAYRDQSTGGRNHHRNQCSLEAAVRALEKSEDQRSRILRLCQMWLYREYCQSWLEYQR